MNGRIKENMAMRLTRSSVQMTMWRGVFILVCGLFPLRWRADECSQMCYGGARKAQVVGVPVVIVNEAEITDSDSTHSRAWEFRPRSGRSWIVSPVPIPPRDGLLILPTFGLPPGEYELRVKGDSACKTIACCGYKTSDYKFLPSVKHSKNPRAEVKWAFDSLTITNNENPLYATLSAPEWSINLSLPQTVDDVDPVYLVRISRLRDRSEEDVHWTVGYTENSQSRWGIHLSDSLCARVNAHLKLGGSYLLSIYRFEGKKLLKTAGWKFTIPEKTMGSEMREKLAEEARLRQSDLANPAVIKRYEDWLTANKSIMEQYRLEREKAINPTVTELRLIQLHEKDIPPPPR